jgi:hypothetical protein
MMGESQQDFADNNLFARLILAGQEFPPASCLCAGTGRKKVRVSNGKIHVS